MADFDVDLFVIGGGSGGGSSSGTNNSKGNNAKNGTKGPATSATYSKTGGATPVAGVQLTATELAARRGLALKALGAVQPASSTPLLLAIIDILVIALCPWIIWHRRRSLPGRSAASTPEGS